MFILWCVCTFASRTKHRKYAWVWHVVQKMLHYHRNHIKKNCSQKESILAEISCLQTTEKNPISAHILQNGWKPQLKMLRAKSSLTFSLRGIFQCLIPRWKGLDAYFHKIQCLCFVSDRRRTYAHFFMSIIYEFYAP